MTKLLRNGGICLHTMQICYAKFVIGKFGKRNNEILAVKKTCAQRNGFPKGEKNLTTVNAENLNSSDKAMFFAVIS